MILKLMCSTNRSWFAGLSHKHVPVPSSLGENTPHPAIGIPAQPTDNLNCSPLALKLPCWFRSLPFFSLCSVVCLLSEVRRVWRAQARAHCQYWKRQQSPQLEAKLATERPRREESRRSAEKKKKVSSIDTEEKCNYEKRLAAVFALRVSAEPVESCW